MNKNKVNLLKLITLIVFATGLLLFNSCKKEKKTEPVILSVQTVIGDVKIISAGVEKKPVVGQKINAADFIKTGKYSVIDIKYKNRGILRISQNSKIKVAVLFFSKDSDKTGLEADSGKIFVTMSKLQKGSTFFIKTKTAVAGVRGTTFVVSVDAKKSKIEVLSGKIKVNPVRENKVIESMGKIIEKDDSVVLDKKTVNELVDNKREIKVVRLKPEEVKQIREEAKNIKIDETMDAGVKEEVEKVDIKAIFIAKDAPRKDKKTAEEEKIKIEKEIVETIKRIEIRKKEKVRKFRRPKSMKATGIPEL